MSTLSIAIFNNHFPTTTMLEASLQEAGCRLLKGIALDQVTDSSVNQLEEDFRLDLAQALGLSQISEAFYEKWDRIISGLRTLTREEIEQLIIEEAKYGGVEETDYRCEVEITDDAPEGRLVATYSMDDIGGRFHIPDESDPVLQRIRENDHS